MYVYIQSTSVILLRSPEREEKRKLQEGMDEKTEEGRVVWEVRSRRTCGCIIEFLSVSIIILCFWLTVSIVHVTPNLFWDTISGSVT